MCGAAECSLILVDACFGLALLILNAFELRGFLGLLLPHGLDAAGCILDDAVKATLVVHLPRNSLDCSRLLHELVHSGFSLGKTQTLKVLMEPSPVNERTRDAALVSCGQAGRSRASDTTSIDRRLREFERRYGLPHLTPAYMRHWVKTALRRSGLSDPAIAAWQGRNPPRDGSMKNWYDNPGVEALLDEQSHTIPRGPLGLLTPPEVKLVEGPEREAIEIVADYLSGRIGLMDVLSRLETLKRKHAEPVTKP